MYHIFDTVSVYSITFCLNNDINFSQRLLCIYKISFTSKESLLLCYNFSFFLDIYPFANNSSFSKDREPFHDYPTNQTVRDKDSSARYIFYREWKE